MKDYTIEHSEFLDKVSIVEINDPAHADVINKPIKQLFANTMANKIKIDNKTTEIFNRLIALENAVYNDITGNPWTLTFNDLEGINLTKGNYNRAEHRIEC